MANFNPLPYTLANGTTADATQVMSNFNQIVANGNANVAENGANSSITSLNGLTTPLSIAQGGTGSSSGATLNSTGMMTLWAGSPSAPPAGWLYCDGSAISRTTYALLFAAIGTAYGDGDGSTTFNIPDMRGSVPAGYDSGNATGRLTEAETQGVSAAALGNSGGEQGHTLITGELAAHNHGVTDPGHLHIIIDPKHGHAIDDPGHVHEVVVPVNPNFGYGQVVAGNTDANFVEGTVYTTEAAATNIAVFTAATGITNQTSTTGITTNNAGSGNAHNNVQPTLIVGFIIKT